MAVEGAEDLVLAGEDLLPPYNATRLEQQIALTWRFLQDIDPSVISTIWDPWRCPAALLPWLAWALSVNVWNDAWDEIRQRQAIADSIPFHLVKGSRASVEQALDTLQRPYALTEWWEITPNKARGTARVFVQLAAGDALAALLAETRRLVLMSKPKSRYVYIGVGLEQDAPVPVAVVPAYSMLLTVQPYVAALPEIDGPINTAAVVATAMLLTIQPAQA